MPKHCNHESVQRFQSLLGKVLVELEIGRKPLKPLNTVVYNGFEAGVQKQSVLQCFRILSCQNIFCCRKLSNFEVLRTLVCLQCFWTFRCQTCCSIQCVQCFSCKMLGAGDLQRQRLKSLKRLVFFPCFWWVDCTNLVCCNVLKCKSTQGTNGRVGT